MQEDDVRKQYIVRDRHCNCAAQFIRPQYAVSLCSEHPPLLPPRGGGTPENFWWGCAPSSSKPWLYFRQKDVVFQNPFSDPASEIHTRSRKWPVNRTHFQTTPLKSIPVSIRSVPILRLQTQMAELCTHFQTKMAQTPYSLGWHIPI